MHNDKPTVTSRIANWKDDKEVLSAIRHQVFVQEQSVPEEMEWDDHDESSTHYLATMNNRVVAVARLKPDGQLGRMAVLTEFRHQGIGSNLLHFILLDIKDKGLSG
ncbi:MAG: GNAT family N-acetyltransferase, partial [Gammaproteobacteria bacterium]|nr:GNAT family N-acetyltransferase [Gammaproteobacteria bacterium]